jgi:hypothetical protein
MADYNRRHRREQATQRGAGDVSGHAGGVAARAPKLQGTGENGAGGAYVWRRALTSAFRKGPFDGDRPWLFSNSGPVVNLSMNILAGSRVLSAVGTRPPHDGVR